MMKCWYFLTNEDPHMLRFHRSISHFVEYCRLSSSFIWGTSCWMVTLWGDGRCITITDIQLKLLPTLGHAPPHDAACHDASDPFGAEERISHQNMHLSPCTSSALCWGKSNPLSRARINWACLTAGCPIEVMFGHVSEFAAEFSKWNHARSCKL